MAACSLRPPLPHQPLGSGPGKGTCGLGHTGQAWPQAPPALGRVRPHLPGTTAGQQGDWAAQQRSMVGPALPAQASQCAPSPGHPAPQPMSCQCHCPWAPPHPPHAPCASRAAMCGVAPSPPGLGRHPPLLSTHSRGVSLPIFECDFRVENDTMRFYKKWCLTPRCLRLFVSGDHFSTSTRLGPERGSWWHQVPSSLWQAQALFWARLGYSTPSPTWPSVQCPHPPPGSRGLLPTLGVTFELTRATSALLSPLHFRHCVVSPPLRQLGHLCPLDHTVASGSLGPRAPQRQVSHLPRVGFLFPMSLPLGPGVRRQVCVAAWPMHSVAAEGEAYWGSTGWVGC